MVFFKKNDNINFIHDFIINKESQEFSKGDSTLIHSTLSDIKMTSRIHSKERKTSYSDLNQLSKFVYIDYVLNTEDSLHSLSMKFGVNLSELKRINFLQNDRDIYALKTLKIPIKPYSLLAEQYADQLKYTDSNLTRLNTNILDFDYDTKFSSPADSENEFSDTGNKQTIESETFKIGFSENGEILAETEFFQINDDKVSLLNNERNSREIESNRTSTNKQYKEAKRYLKKLDNNLETLKNQNNELITNVSKNEQLIPILDTSYSIENKNRSNFTKFSNLNLNVRDLLIFACLIVIIFPLIFYIYKFYE